MQGDFRRLAEEEAIRLFVVGLPVHLDGRESEKSAGSTAFRRVAQETTGVPVRFFDERFTSRQAEDALLAAQLTKKRRKARHGHAGGSDPAFGVSRIRRRRATRLREHWTTGHEATGDRLRLPGTSRRAEVAEPRG